MKKEQSFTKYEFFSAIFYVLIVLIGVNLCFDSGRSADIYDLVAITACISAVFIIKLIKKIRVGADGIGGLVFSGIMSALGIVTLVLKLLS